MIEKTFDDMDDSFKEAYLLSNVHFYKQSIPLYQKAIDRDENNFAALNNIAVAKINIGIKESNIKLLEESIESLERAINITTQLFNDNYPIAQANLEWAKKELKNFKSQ